MNLKENIERIKQMMGLNEQSKNPFPFLDSDYWDYANLDLTPKEYENNNFSNTQEKDEVTVKKDDIIVKDDVVESDPSLTVVIGGCCFATPEYMKKQWIKAGLSTKNVKFIGQRDVLPSGNVKKIMGFSGGGSKVWGEIISNSSKYDFIGLIDPYTQGATTQSYVDKLINKTTTLPSNVYAMSYSGNWGGSYLETQKNLKKLESLDLSNWEKGIYAHTETGDYPYHFFTEYKNYLS